MLSVAGGYTAAAELGRMTVWSGHEVIARVEARTPTPGRARVNGRAARWGECVVDLATGDLRWVEGIRAALVAGTGTPADPPPSGGYVAAAYAWSSDGDALVVTAGWSGPPGPPAARAVLLDDTGRYRATLWEGSDVAPKSAWVGRDMIVIGTREPRAFERDGSPLVELDATTPAARIEADAEEKRVLVMEHGRVTVWNVATWKPVGVWEGQWLDAAITPDGHIVVAVDLSGRLHAARLDDGLSDAAELDAPDPIQSIALGDDRIAATFMAGEPVRTAALSAR
jgi:hypothetical protein